MYIEPAELADGDLRCRGCIERLWTEDGRDSELGVWAPNDRLWGSLRGRDIDATCSPYEEDSNIPTCADVMEERFELTLLDRREETEPRLARFAAFLPAVTFGRPPLVRRFTEPRPRPVTGLVVPLEGYARLCGASAGGGSFLLPLASSLNHMRNVVKRLARFRLFGSFEFSPIVGRAPVEPPGELTGVGGGECCAFARTQGEPTCADIGIEESRLWGGVLGSVLIGFNGGDFAPRLEPA